MSDSRNSLMNLADISVDSLPTIPRALPAPDSRPSVSNQRVQINKSESQGNDYGERLCWICLSTDADNPLAGWVQPCKCRGSNQWVHETCLYRWVDEKQRGNVRRPVRCPQCQTEYIIILPVSGIVTQFFEAVDNAVKRMSPFVAAGIIFGFVYWNALTYGAITILQVLDAKDGLELLEKSSPIVLLIGLPVIPVSLILCRMIRWEDAILHLIRNRRNIARKIPLMNTIMSSSEDDVVLQEDDPDAMAPFNRTSTTRTLCGALLLPTISSIVGHILFENVGNPLHRTLLGAVTFVMVKGIVKIYLKQMQYIRLRQRRVLKYSEENARMFAERNSLSRERTNIDASLQQLPPQPLQLRADLSFQI